MLNPQNKKKKTKPKPQAEASPGPADPRKLVSTGEEQSANSEKGGINGFHVNGCAHDTEDCEPAVPDMPERTG